MAEERSTRFSDNAATSEIGQTYAYAQQDITVSTGFTDSGRIINRKKHTGYLLVKRAFDILSSICLLIVIWPVFAAIAIAIKVDSKGPVIFKHRRIGQNGRVFTMYKFRSMVTNAEALISQFTPQQRKEWEENYKLSYDPRLTGIGRFLRKTSLDELPQILNILQGTLSAVGPRPVIERELEKYGESKEKFLSAKPGLTGFWQAYARSDCSYEQRMRMELFYVDHANFFWDMKIIGATVLAVIRKKGAK